MSRASKKEKFVEKQSGKGKKGKKGKVKWVEEEQDSSDYFDELILSHYNDDEENEQLVFDNNDEDFFACEELDGDSNEPIIVRQARTAKAKENVNDDTPCGRCGFYDNAEWVCFCLLSFITTFY